MPSISNKQLAKRIDNHEAKWCDCTKCPLGKKAINHVLWLGSIPATYLFIGEAPGPIEDQVGEPFIGNAGKVLHSLLADVKLTKKDYCITNTLACFPFKPESPLDFRKPKQIELKECMPRVKDLIELVQPKTIILLGDVARAAFNRYILTIDYAFGSTKILDLRHPTFIDRNGGIGSVEYKRNLEKLKGYVRETKKRI